MNGFWFGYISRNDNARGHNGRSGNADGSSNFAASVAAEDWADNWDDSDIRISRIRRVRRINGVSQTPRKKSCHEHGDNQVFNEHAITAPVLDAHFRAAVAQALSGAVPPPRRRPAYDRP